MNLKELAGLIEKNARENSIQGGIELINTIKEKIKSIQNLIGG